MAKAHTHSNLEEARLSRGGGSVSGDAKVFGRAPKEQWVANWIGGRELHEASGLGWERVDTALVGLLDVLRDATSTNRFEPAGELCRRHISKQLQHGERDAARFGDDLFADARVNGGSQD